MVYLILLLLLLLGILLFTETLRVKFLFDSTNQDVNLTFSWLYPFLKVLFSIEDEKPMITITLFKVQVTKKALKAKKRKKNGIKLIQAAKVADVHVTTNYGFKDPATTGIACGVVGILSQLIKLETFKHSPDFLARDNYIYVKATANVNVGSTLLRSLNISK